MKVVLLGEVVSAIGDLSVEFIVTVVEYELANQLMSYGAYTDARVLTIVVGEFDAASILEDNFPLP